MTTRTNSKKQRAGKKKGRVKVGRLKVNKETVKDLSSREEKSVKAGAGLMGSYGCIKVTR